MAKSYVQGDKALGKALKRLGPAANKILRKVLRAGTKEVANEIKSIAPVGETGQLKRAIKVRAAKRKKGRIAFMAQIGEGSFKGETFYGSFVDLGTAKQDPQDFMEKPFDQHAGRVGDEILEETWKAIEAEWKKGAK